MAGGGCGFLIRNMAMIPLIWYRVAKLSTVSIPADMELYRSLSLYYPLLVLKFELYTLSHEMHGRLQLCLLRWTTNVGEKSSWISVLSWFCVQLLQTVLLWVLWHSGTEEVLEVNSFASKIDSPIVSGTSWTLPGQEAACRGEKSGKRYIEKAQTCKCYQDLSSGQ